MSDLGVIVIFNCYTVIDSLMEPEREEESGKMYSLNESGEYTPHGDVLNFTVQGLRDALTEAESAVTEPPPLQMNSSFNWK